MKDLLGRVAKWVFYGALGAGIALGASYTGARARAGTYLGSRLPNLGTRTVELAYEGVPELPGQPIAWVISYGPTAIKEAPRIRIYVSPMGKLIATFPGDLEKRLEPYWRITL